MKDRVYNVYGFVEKQLERWKAPREVFKSRRNYAEKGCTEKEADDGMATNIELVDHYLRYSYRSKFN